jgi:hypothetical protein
MVVPFRQFFVLAAACALAVPCLADEIRLKDGKKLYGVIVSYEENMFKVKTDFGYVLVEKDKIASIVPTTPAGPPPDPKAQPAKNGATDPAKTESKAATKMESASASGTDAAPAPTNTSAKTVVPGQAGKQEKAAGKVLDAAVKPSLPPASTPSEAVAPALKSSPAVSNAASPASVAQPATPPKQPEVPTVPEEVLGNLYVNHTHGFKMYKAPSWELIEDAQNALPNAVAAMGTSNESTLIVVGREKTKEPLETAAAGVEKRLHEVYEGYRQTSHRKTTVAGSPAVEFRYIGRADEHDWSGTLLVIGRGADIFTVLGMTYADSDLIQIQENVISKAVGSLSFDVK